MIRLLSIPLLFTLVLNLSSSWIQIGWFYTNRTEIAFQSCVNQDLPQLDCNGHCVLASKLKQQSSESEDPILSEFRLITLFIVEQAIIYLSKPEAPGRFAPKYPLTFEELVDDIFHPPPH